MNSPLPISITFIPKMCLSLIYSIRSESKYVYVNIGYGFHVQLTHDEARTFIQKKEHQLNAYAEELTQNAGKIKAHIRMILETLRQLTLTTSID
jgi:prefoldin subunit 5